MRSERRNISSEERENGLFGCENGYGMPAVDKPPPSAKSLRQFKRAMRILGLKVFVRSRQRGRTLLHEVDDGEENKEKKPNKYGAGFWPTLQANGRAMIPRT